MNEYRIEEDLNLQEVIKRILNNTSSNDWEFVPSITIFNDEDINIEFELSHYQEDISIVIEGEIVDDTVGAVRDIGTGLFSEISYAIGRWFW